MKHNWRKNADGTVDEFAWTADFHNGVFCEDCGHSECVICNPNYDDDESCPGPRAPLAREKVQPQHKTTREIAYEKYKLSWMLGHGFTLSDLLRELHAYQADVFALLPELFAEWEADEGFSAGSIWACFDEFLDAEYQDEAFMKTLLTESEFTYYLADRKEGKENV